MPTQAQAINRTSRLPIMSLAEKSHSRVPRRTPSQSPAEPERNTRMKSQAAYEHEFAHNLTFTGRFVYRDLRRAIEDMSGINVSQANAGVPQIYVIGNPSAALDIFQNVSPCVSGPNCDTSTGFTFLW